MLCFIHVAAWYQDFIFMAENILFVPLHLSIGGYLGYFNSLIIMNNDAMNTRTNYCGDACFQLCWYISRSRIAE